METVSIFVDVQNIYNTTKQIYHCNFDYNSFWKKITRNRNVIKAIAYTTDRGDEKQKQFQNILRKIGFEVKLKPFIQRRDGSTKGDWDVGITIDILENAKKSNIIVLASGDGDFSILIDKIKKDFSVKCEIYGVPKLTANSLIKSSSIFHPISGDLLLKHKVKV